MKNLRLVSQSFLGSESDATLENLKIAVIGLGGGGSHIVQQLTHLGIGNFILIDDDLIEYKNLNRLVGGTMQDVKEKKPKVEIALRVIKAVNPNAEVVACQSRWQNVSDTMRGCDVIFGCVDSYGERDQLERFARRFLIPYIDIGMDVHESNNGFAISGQTVLSLPSMPCLWCLGILTDKRLKREAEQYGKAGSRPQVVWVNGALASIAVGMFVQLVCPWNSRAHLPICCEYDGNSNKAETNRSDAIVGVRCPHFKPNMLGDPFFKKNSVSRNG